MYNSYKNDDFYFKQFNKENAIIPEHIETSDVKNSNEEKSPSIFSGMFNNINMPEINGETLILFAVIFFSIYDDFDMDLIIILGILFLIGI